MRAEEVASLIDKAIACNPSGSSIFVHLCTSLYKGSSIIVHGMGTGRLRTKVHKALKHPEIVRLELGGIVGVDALWRSSADHPYAISEGSRHQVSSYHLFCSQGP